MPPLDVEWAYAAGIIDGEGCISVSARKNSKGNRSFRVAIKMTMTDFEVPVWMHRTFGGHFHTRGKPRWEKELYFWSACGVMEDTRSFLQGIVPFLVLKKNRAESAIKILTLQIDRGTHRVPVKTFEETSKLVTFIKNENQRLGHREKSKEFALRAAIGG